MSDKRFYWIKVKNDFFDLPEIDWLQDQENGCQYIVLYQKLCLLTANSAGELVRKVGDMIIPYDVKKIAEMTRFDFDTVAVAVSLYKKIGLVIEREDGVLVIANIGEMVGSETRWAEKKRLQREQKKALPAQTTEENEDKKGHEGDNVPSDVPDNKGTNAPTLSDKRSEYRDQSIEFRDQSKSTENKQQQLPRARVREGEVCKISEASNSLCPHSRDKPDDDFGEVMRTFADNIHPVTGAIEADKLADLYDTYGSKWVIAAITEAVECGGRNLRYISAILERWQRDGFKAQRKTKGAVQGGTGEGDHSADVSAAETPWIQQLREWEERKRNSPRPWDVQPPAGGNRDAPGGDHTDRGRAG
jgi:phage replisome organizer N-terminal domain protein